MTARLTFSTTLSLGKKLVTDQTETTYGTSTSLKPKNVKDDHTIKLPSSITSTPKGQTSATSPTVIPSTIGWFKRPRDFIKERSTLPVTVINTKNTTTTPNTESASTRVSLKYPRDFIKETSTTLPTTTASTTATRWSWLTAKPKDNDKTLSTVPITIKQTNNFFNQKSTTLPATTPSTSTTTKRPIDKLIGGDETLSTAAPSTTKETTKHRNHIFEQKSTTLPATTPSTTKPTTASWKDVRKSTTFPSTTTTTKHPTTITDEQRFTKDGSPATSPSLPNSSNPKKRKIDDKIPLDFIPSRIEDPVPFESKQIFIKETNEFMLQQSRLESKASMDAIRAIHKEKEIRYAMKSITLRRLQEHPFFRRMLNEVTREMIEERKDWRKYHSNPRYKDTITSRRRIQPEISDYFLKYAIKFNKRPWLHPGKNKIKTKFYERVDFVDKPFIVTEEKTETKVQHEIVKAKTK